MKNKQDRIVALLMLLPTFILLGIFVYFFLGKTVFYSLSDWGENPAAPALSENLVLDNLSFQNYENLMTDMVQAMFRNSLTNMFFFFFFFVLGSVAIGLFLTIVLDQRIVGESFFRIIFLAPMSLSFVVTGTIWRWLLQPDGGLNSLPTLFGFEPLQFNWLNSQEIWLQFDWSGVPTYLSCFALLILAFLLGRAVLNRRWRSAQLMLLGGLVVLLLFFSGLWDRFWLPLDAPTSESSFAPKGFNAALIGIILAAVWQMSGYAMAVFTAGLRGIPDDLREAAAVDGCSELKIYTHVLLPQLRPLMLSTIVILGHTSLKIFDLIFVMTGPDSARTVVPGILIYTKGFRQNSFAQASAIATMLLLLVILLIVPYIYARLRSDD